MVFKFSNETCDLELKLWSEVKVPQRDLASLVCMPGF